MQIRLGQLFGHIGIAVGACAVQIVFQLGNFRHGIFQLGFCVIDHIGNRLDSISLRQNRLFCPPLFGIQSRRVFLITGSGFRFLGLLCFFGFAGIQQLQGLLAQLNYIAALFAAIFGIYLLNNLFQTGILHLSHGSL